MLISNSQKYRYNPIDPPSVYKDEPRVVHDFIQGEVLHNQHMRTRDFFESQDNTSLDLDPRDGYVKLIDCPAPGLILTDTATVYGTLKPNREMSVSDRTSSPLGGDLSMTVRDGGDSVELYVPSLRWGAWGPGLTSTLQYNPDGTRTTSAY